MILNGYWTGKAGKTGKNGGICYQYGAALALAAAGNSKAETLADQLRKQFPEDTIVQFIYLPTIQAEFALKGNDPAKAIDALQAAAPYELGSPGNTAAFTPSLYPIYVRGQAYLAAHRGSEAAAEFEKILTGAAWFKINPSLHWPTSDLHAPMPSKAIPPKHAPPTRTS